MSATTVEVMSCDSCSAHIDPMETTGDVEQWIKLSEARYFRPLGADYKGDRHFCGLPCLAAWASNPT